MSVSFTHKWLYRVGLRPLELAVDDVKQLADAVWYRGYCPSKEELEQLCGVMPPEACKRTLCVLELLSYYPVCPRATARYLQQLTQKFHRQLLGNEDTPTEGRYSPSQRWGLTDTTAPLRKGTRGK